MRSLVALPFLVLLLSAPSAQAQHCGWCGSNMMVIEPYAPGDTTVIPGLRITVVDSAGKIMMLSGWYSRPDRPIIFQQGLWDTTDHHMVAAVGLHPDFNRSYLFPQVSYYRVPGSAFVVIEDVDGEANGGHFVTQVHPLCRFPGFSLCRGRYHRDHEGPRVQLERHRVDEVNGVPLPRISEWWNGWESGIITHS